MKLKINLKSIIISLALILFASPINAAYNSFAATGDFILKSIKIKDSTNTADIIVFESSKAEKIRIDNGVVQVFLQSGSLLKIGSADANVQSIVYYNDTEEYCVDNTTPGTTQIDVFSYGYTEYYLKLQTIVCPQESVTPESVEIVEEYDSVSGVATTTITQGETEIETVETSDSSSDGTLIIKAVTKTKTKGKESEVYLKTKISIIEAPSDTQSINLNSESGRISKIKMNLSPDLLEGVVDEFGNSNDLEIDAYYKEAGQEQIVENVEIIDSKVFSIDMDVSGSEITTFDDPLELSFDISDVDDKKNLTVAWFDEDSSDWSNLETVISGDTIIATVDHLTDFALIVDTRVDEEETTTQTQTTSSSGGGGNSSWILNVPSVTSETTEEPEIITTEDTSKEKENQNVKQDLQLTQILNDASIVFKSGTNLDKIIKYNNAVKNIEAQKNGIDKYTMPIVKGFDLTINQTYAINNFIVYGTKGTKILGAGERAGVVNSYKKAFNKVPKTQEEWEDVIKIGNGRWPNKRSETAESKANIEFVKIYKRSANMNNPNDNAAVAVIAYGLRPSNRNLDSEKVAIKTFKYIYKYHPTSALDWDITRAIAYSGATREVQGKTTEAKQDISTDNAICKSDTNFNQYLFYGAVSSQVSELQELLQCLGYFVKDKKITNFFGNLTSQAVKDFQKDNKVKQTGTVGQFTRSLLNKY